MIDEKLVKVGNFFIFNDEVSSLYKLLKQRSDSEQSTAIVTINPEIYLHALKNESHFKAIKNSDIIVADGFGVVWAGEYCNSKFKNKLLKFLASWFNIFYKKNKLAIKHRITGVDLTLKLCAESFLPVKIYGSRLGSGRLAKENLLKMFPNLKIDVYEDVEVNAEGQIIFEQNNSILSEKCLLLLALGAPKQELLMQNLKSRLFPGTIVIGVGGTVDFISGKAIRAPLYLRNFGLEWLFRLITEPKRFKRIINATIVFPYKFIKKY